MKKIGPLLLSLILSFNLVAQALTVVKQTAILKANSAPLKYFH